MLINEMSIKKWGFLVKLKVQKIYGPANNIETHVPPLHEKKCKNSVRSLERELRPRRLTHLQYRQHQFRKISLIISYQL